MQLTLQQSRDRAIASSLPGDADCALMGPAMPWLLRDECLHELFEIQADLRPNQIALVCGSDTLTYRELEERANRLADELRDRGAGPGKIIALWMTRSADAYVAMLGVLKAGAAYLPIDSDYPLERVRSILKDSQAAMLLSDIAAPQSPGSFNCQFVLLPAIAARLASRSPVRHASYTTPANLAYVIYTSGSTGTPKGVAVEHRNVCHLVRAEAWIFSICPGDRVYQGFSLAFDASIETIWLAFFAGATLVASCTQSPRSGPDLARSLAKDGVTVLSTVPTLAATLEIPIPSLRLLIVGAESCPADLVKRLVRPGLRIVNTYGPTEATVVATWCDLHLSEPVRIGSPLPNYRVYLLDDHLEPVQSGESGEICIAGPGVARGYLCRDDLTRTRFVENPLSDSALYDRLYRTGDFGRLAEDGQLEFLGRGDTQVKIRGYRVELAEIESALLACDGIQAAVVAMRNNELGIQHLIAYITIKPDVRFDESAALAALRGLLPSYMVPSAIEVLTEFPRASAHGKVDRTRLPDPKPREVPPLNTDLFSPSQAIIAQSWARLFKTAEISPDTNFFMDLGGHSLTAAIMVSELRCSAGFESLSIADVYSHPTITHLADRAISFAPLASPALFPASRPNEEDPGGEPVVWRHRACSFAQMALLYPLLLLVALEYLGPYALYAHLHASGRSVATSLAYALALVLTIGPVMLLIAASAKWLLLSRVSAGRYPMWGFFFLRWWFVRQIMELAPTDSLEGTPLLAWYYRLLGARIGRDVFLASDNIGAFDLVSIGDQTHIGYDAGMLAYTIEEGYLTLAPITIGARCTIGARSMLRPGSSLENDAMLGDLSLLPTGTTIPAGERWAGSPAVKTSPAPAPTNVTAPRRAWITFAQALAGFFMPGVYLVALFPGIFLLNYAFTELSRSSYYAIMPAVAAIFVLTLTLLIAALKWLLVGRVKPGAYPIHSAWYLRKWIVDRLLAMSLDLLGSLYATLYLNPWYRLLGAKLGARAEISTAASASPDLLTLGEESFVADSVALGYPHFSNGQMVLAPTSIGRRAFVGNSAVIPGGTVVGDSVLIGVLSTTPAQDKAATTGSDWLGSPAFALQRRNEKANFDEAHTFRPTRSLYVQRLAIELARILVPPTIYIALASLFISSVHNVKAATSWPIAILVAPLAYFAAGIVGCALAVASKWILVGTYKPGEKPLWSSFVWRTEFITSMHESLADPILLSHCAGTIVDSLFFRAMGARVGKRVFFDTGALTEFDLISIGDDVALNVDATIQTHLFEDRVMKMSTIYIGNRSSVGAGSIVLYDTRIEEDCIVSDLTLVMKGERLASRTTWQGSPARRA